MQDTYSAYPIRAHAYLMPLVVLGNKAWLLTGVEVAADKDTRGKGVARELMRRVLADADAEGVTLYLSIEPDGTGLDEDQLRAWYTRLGFVNDDSLERDLELSCISDLAMMRKPKPM